MFLEYIIAESGLHAFHGNLFVTSTGEHDYGYIRVLRFYLA